MTYHTLVYHYPTCKFHCGCGAMDPAPDMRQWLDHLRSLTDPPVADYTMLSAEKNLRRIWLTRQPDLLNALTAIH